MAEAKRRFLDAATADGKGAKASTGVRYWVSYCVFVLGINPIQPPDASIELRRKTSTRSGWRTAEYGE